MADEGRSRISCSIAGGLVTAGAAASITGWLAGWPALAEPLPGYALQPEAAIGLALCGVGVVLAAGRGAWRRGAVLFGAMAILLIIADQVVYVFGLDLGVDSVFPRAARIPGARPPEPMAPNAALGLVLAGAALATGGRAPMLRCALGACCAALGVSAVLGHATGVHPAYGWGSSPRMTPPAAGGLAILGLTLGLLRDPGSDSVAVRHWRGPLLVGFSSTVATLLFTQALSQHQDRQLHLMIDAGASRLQAEMRGRFEERMEALELLASVWGGRFFPSREAWESDADLIMSQSPGVEAIEWIESGGEVKWVHPTGSAPGTPDPRSLEAQSGSSNAIVLGSLPRAGKRSGLLIMAPLRASDADRGWLSGIVGDRDGWLAGVFDTQQLLSDLVAPLSSSYAIRIASEGKLFFESEGSAWDAESRWTEQRVLELPGGMRLTTWAQPSAELLDARRSLLVPVLLGGGLFVSVLLALALGLANISRARATRLEGEIGERLRAEEEVRRLNEDLEERVRQRTLELSRSNEDLRQFAAFLSHELRQPVATQDVWVELLETQCSDGLDDSGRRYLAEIRSVSNQIAEAIDAQLTLFSTTGTPLHLERVALGPLVEGLLAEMKERLESHHAEVRVGELPVLRADARLLRQFFRNLLDNALKYRRRDVPLVVQLYPGQATPDASATLSIVVEDNGQGFPQVDAERILEAGGRVDAEREGSGLGLTVCSRIAERHGGELRAEGRPGSGARFRLLLPRTLEESEDRAPTRGAMAGPRRVC
jgi:signal transduction histidine kinase